MGRTRTLPRALGPGDTVAVVAPASPPGSAALEAGIESLKARGLKVRLGKHALDRDGHLAGADRDRAKDLMDAFLDPKIDAVFCARGGAGSARIIPYLDLPAIAQRPKVFVGYSDITVLHLAIARYAAWPTFYGPMVASEMEGSVLQECLETLWRLISVAEPAGALEPCHPERKPATLVAGVAEGVLSGGTLCVIESSLGTAYAPTGRGRILVLEDFSEPLWRVDRMLTHLDHVGLLRRANGFLVGDLAMSEDHEPASSLTEERCLRDHLEPLGKPALHRFPFGHIAAPLTLPLGCRARLDADAGTLTVLEPAVTHR